MQKGVDKRKKKWYYKQAVARRAGKRAKREEKTDLNVTESSKKDFEKIKKVLDKLNRVW